MLAIGTKAPAFSLPDQNGKKHTLAEHSGTYVLLYFYPKDNTPGCTTEACAIRDAWDEYEKRDITVLGISKDSVGSHKKFETDHDLPFTLLSDEHKEIIKAYGALQGAFTRRTSYLIDPKGIIVAVYPKVDPGAHAVQVLKDIDGIIKGQK